MELPSPSQITFVVFLGLLIAISVALIGSWLTIMSVNILFAKEVIALTMESVIALAWIKFMTVSILGGIVRIKNFQG